MPNTTKANDKNTKPKTTWQQEAFRNGYVQSLIDDDTTGSLAEYWTWWREYYKKYKEAPTQDLVDRRMAKTAWYAERTAAQEKAALQEAQNPEDFARDIEAKKALVRDRFAQLGLEFDESDLNSFAREARVNGWNDAEITDRILPKIQSQLETGKNLRGTAGEWQNELSQWANRNGISLSPEAASRFITRGATGEQTIEDAKQELRDTYLIGAYPAWEDKIRQGYDPEVLAAPYRGAAERLLELGDNSLSLNDPLMQKALQGTDAQGKPSVVPLWQYEQTVRSDPRWQKTDNAYKTYTDVGNDILKMFGFG